ncbi:hypothetical protein ANCCAN_26842 [Ancylostoma caninum]|uniref:Uncharacterized protein n=1 Tax=Ancylostoma caninum TaxID=29170 RepID=A0A368F5R8_ANCCA|nr:hypothetical protein ANCCAN_26842 [Ancylostoma caninum]
MHTNECGASGSGSSDSSSSNIMNFYKAERLRVMRMRQQYSSQPSSIEVQKGNGEEMDVEVTNDENISSNNTLFAVMQHRLGMFCKFLCPDCNLASVFASYSGMLGIHISA